MKGRNQPIMKNIPFISLSLEQHDDYHQRPRPQEGVNQVVDKLVHVVLLVPDEDCEVNWHRKNGVTRKGHPYPITPRSGLRPRDTPCGWSCCGPCYRRGAGPYRPPDLPAGPTARP